MVYAFFKKFKYEIGKTYEAEILPTTEVSNFDMIATAALKKELGIRHRVDRLLKQSVADGTITCYGPGLHSCATPDRLSMPWSPGRLRKQTEYYGIIGVPGVAIVECTIPGGLHRHHRHLRVHRVEPTHREPGPPQKQVPSPTTGNI